jgi:putative DNA primase/helicase
MSISEINELQHRAGEVSRDTFKAKAEVMPEANGGISAEATVRTLEAPEVKPKPGKKSTRLQGDAIELFEPVPWPEPVDGAVVLTDVAETLQQHMAMRDVDAYVVALWCAHTHVFDRFSHTPRLAITGPAPECGKTVLLSHLIGNLVNRPQSTDNMSPAAFYRMASGYQPAFLIDEVDAWLRVDNDLPGAINGGFERHGGVTRCVGDNQEVRRFRTHAPVAFAGIRLQKKLPDPTLSRSILVELERALPGEVAECYDRRRHKQSLQVLCRQLARWTADCAEALANCDPVLPPGILNRQADKWQPLFALASTAGGLWPEWIKRALLAEEGSHTGTKGILLLEDIRTVLDSGHYSPVIFTDELIGDLCEPEDSVWRDHNFRSKETKIKPRQLSNLLAGFKCKPAKQRRGEVVRSGYRADQLQAAIRRYLPR